MSCCFDLFLTTLSAPPSIATSLWAAGGEWLPLLLSPSHPCFCSSPLLHLQMCTYLRSNTPQMVLYIFSGIINVTFHLFFCLVANPSSSLCLCLCLVLCPGPSLVLALCFCPFSPSLSPSSLCPSPSLSLHLFLLQKRSWILTVTETMGVAWIASQGYHLSFSSCSIKLYNLSIDWKLTIKIPFSYKVLKHTELCGSRDIFDYRLLISSTFLEICFCFACCSSPLPQSAHVWRCGG